MTTSITIDGETYTIPLMSLKRKSDPLYKYAERVQSGSLKSELIGVFINYDVEFGQSLNDLNEYSALYSKVTEPVESHEVILPNENGGLPFTVYFSPATDEIIKSKTTRNYYRSLSFSIICCDPSRIP
jgi:hypothetical protein